MAAPHTAKASASLHHLRVVAKYNYQNLNSIRTVHQPKFPFQDEPNSHARTLMKLHLSYVLYTNCEYIYIRQSLQAGSKNTFLSSNECPPSLTRLPNVPVVELKWKYISSRSTSNVTSVSMIFCKCTRLLYVCENWKYRIFLPLSILLVYNTLCVYLSAYILIFILLYFFVSKHSIKILVSQTHKHIWYVLSDAPHTYAACSMLLLLNGCAKARFLVLLRVSLATLKWIVLNLGIYGDVCASNAISGCISKPTYFIHIYI